MSKLLHAVLFNGMHFKEFINEGSPCFETNEGGIANGGRSMTRCVHCLCTSYKEQKREPHIPVYLTWKKLCDQQDQPTESLTVTHTEG